MEHRALVLLMLPDLVTGPGVTILNPWTEEKKEYPEDARLLFHASGWAVIKHGTVTKWLADDDAARFGTASRAAALQGAGPGSSGVWVCNGVQAALQEAAAPDGPGDCVRV